MTNPLKSLAFRQPFRKYQRMILEQVVSQQTDHKYHIVAPPGAGKTIIGLEIVRQLGAHAVVFAPTSTIQAQWYEKVGMFCDDPAQFASMDPHQCAPIQIFTYQLISTPAEAQEHLYEAGKLLWQEELVRDGQAISLEAAAARQDILCQNNPAAYHKEILRYTNRVKHTLLHEPNVEIEPFLHPNARRLINDLVAYGVKTVVLDECHHLLDYWAIVLRYLISRIENADVVGLTATLPSPDGDDEYENYHNLLGDVDFEIPTPAVVKEGDLAPYRDLAFIVKPTPREMEYLNKIQSEFEAAISSLTNNPRFRNWIQAIGSIPPDPSTRPDGHSGQAPDRQNEWQKRWDDHPLLMLAAVRFLKATGAPPDPLLVTPIEAADPLELEDWANLLERFGLDVLKPSADEQDHHLLRDLRKVILPFGLTLTERGMSQSRSPGDLVLTFSESKDFAIAHILAAESKAMGDKLRAVIVTDFERVGTGIRKLKGVLEEDAGSAVRLFELLATHKEVSDLCPVLVTGGLFMIPAAKEGFLLEQFSAYIKRQNLRASCSARETSTPGTLEITGEGMDWTSRTYVRMVTDVFERGGIKCLIGTRGILGEGWDSPTLNTLIDLTSVTTNTAVQQLRGRTLRLDPNWPRKVAHNWDIVCVAPGHKRGLIDFSRFLSRHNQYWSLVIYPDWLGIRRETNIKAPPYLHGKIAKGVKHVSPYLSDALLEEKNQFWKALAIGTHNRYTMNQIPKREQVYDLWDIGQDYSNFSYSTTCLNPKDLKIKTVFTLQQTLMSLIRDLAASVMAVTVALFYNLGQTWLSGLTEGLQAFSFYTVIFCGLAGIANILFNGKKIYNTAKSMFVDQIPDSILLDVGRALLETLRQSGLVSKNLNKDYVRVIHTETETCDVLLDYASPEDSRTFIQAFREIFEPVRDQRYLIMRTEDRMPNLPLQMLWLPLRGWVRMTGMYPPAYHPIPKILASRKERVELYAKYWSEYVGGGRVVFTRTDQGRAILLSARSQRRPNVKQQAFETWR